MKALITGASSGIGKEMACILADLGYDLIVVARREDRLLALKEEVNGNVDVIVADVSDVKQCYALYERVKDEEIDVLINNAGFGDHGYFSETSLEKELSMIQTNVVGLHVLTKLFLKDFMKRNRGHILNVASSAAFLPGPLMSSYYASKSYVLRLSMGIYKELKKQKSDVSISILCPGPVKTEFNQVANVNFALPGMDCKRVSSYAIRAMFAKKLIIIPGLLMKVVYLLSRVVPNFILMECSYQIQRRKDHH